MPKIKNIIIFTIIAVLLILVYIFFIKPSPAQQNLVSSSTSAVTNTATPTDTSATDQNSLIAKNLLSILLSVKSIKLNDAIFSDTAFINLHDSSILLTPSGDEGRANPFAPVGSDAVTTPVAPVLTPPTTPITPALTP